jgi:hypothetical protein
MTKSLLAAIAVAGATAFAAAPTRAAVILQVNGTTITDNGAGDIDLALGEIISTTTGPGFSTTINVGTTTSTPLIDLNSTVISSAAGTLVIKFTETGLTGTAPANWQTQFGSSWTPGSASVRLQTYLDPSNTPFGTAVALADLTSASSPFGLNAIKNAGGVGPFSVTEVLTIHASAARQHFSLDGQVSDAPEPSSIAIAGVALAGLTWLRRGRRGSSERVAAA